MRRPKITRTSRITRTVKNTLRGAIVSSVAIIVASPGAGAQTCAPAWGSGFDLNARVPTVNFLGLNGPVHATVVFDDGTGPALYIGGKFTHANGVSISNIAKWDGVTALSPLGSGVTNEVSALTVFDDGSGAALYAGGFFKTAGGATVNGVAKWDGSSWSPLGSGVNTSGFISESFFLGQVRALTVFDDGTGPALYAGGLFQTAGGAPANGVAKWDGSSWSSLGSGINNSARALTVFDDGTGPALYASGFFTAAGGAPANSIAKWDGLSWSPLGSGVDGVADALTVFDDGTGPALYAGGGFQTAGGSPANSVAKWDGSTWSPLGNSVNGSVDALTVFDDGTGPALYAGGGFTTAGGMAASNIAKWDGSTWSRMGEGIHNGSVYPDPFNPPFVYTLTVFDDGSGAALYAGGQMRWAGVSPANNIGRWNGVGWFDAQGSGVAGRNTFVDEFATLTTSNGTELFATGNVVVEGDVPSGGIGRFDGQHWRTLGGGLNFIADGSFSSDGRINDMAVFDDGSGPAIFAGGSFSSIGGVSAHNIGKWDGSSWSVLGKGVRTGVSGVSNVRALAVFDDGKGPALYVGGLFAMAGNAATNAVAKWDGQVWTALAPLDAALGNVVVNDLAVFDDGAGLALYVAGSFTSAGGDPAIQNVAKWNGATWSSLGAGVDGAVAALDVLNDGAGPALWTRGRFNNAGGQPAARIAKWDGVAWNTLGGGVTSLTDVVNDLAVFDDGAGPAVYATGSFTSIGGVAANNIAKWNGAAWSPLGAIGLNNDGKTLAVFNDGPGQALYVGGSFTLADGVAARRLARWDGLSWSTLGVGIDDTVATFVPSVNALAVFDGPTGPALYAGGNFAMSGGLPASNFARWNGCVASNPADFNGDGFVNAVDLATLLANWGTAGNADLDGNGIVDAADLATLLANWG